MVDSGARAPFGQRQYHPIYEECARRRLPFAIHPRTDGAGINVQHTPGLSHPPDQWHSLLSLAFQSHLVSFITEGVFERYPEFTVVLVEGGVAWLAPLMWRLTDHWRAMRAEVPWMVRPPLEYLHRNVRLTTQPLENPADPRHLGALFADHRGSAGADVLQRLFPLRLRLAGGHRRPPAAMLPPILHGNAAALYGLNGSATPPVD